MNVGYLHPGAMGAALAASTSSRKLWCSQGRSESTRARAEAAGMEEVGSLAELVARADLIVSVCPPGEALRVADEVAAAGFTGMYADMNATSPETARSIATRFEHFVDGGIVGPPPVRAGTTRLYLVGERAAEVAQLWSESALDVRVMDGAAGAASALKLCYAGWTKVSVALLLTIRAAAEAEGVADELLREWARSQPELSARVEGSASGSAAKAWRFVGEMDEIADMLSADGLPAGFASAAADVYRRMAALRDVENPSLDDVLEALNS